MFHARAICAPPFNRWLPFFFRSRLLAFSSRKGASHSSGAIYPSLPLHASEVSVEHRLSYLRNIRNLAWTSRVSRYLTMRGPVLYEVRACLLSLVVFFFTGIIFGEGYCCVVKKTPSFSSRCTYGRTFQEKPYYTLGLRAFPSK